APARRALPTTERAGPRVPRSSGCPKNVPPAPPTRGRRLPAARTDSPVRKRPVVPSRLRGAQRPVKARERRLQGPTTGQREGSTPVRETGLPAVRAVRAAPALPERIRPTLVA